MIQRGANFLSSSDRLVDYLAELYIQKSKVDKQIENLIKDKAQVRNEIEMITQQMKNICESLVWKDIVNELDAILIDGLFIYDKILESSKMLLNILKAEIESVDKIIELKKQYCELNAS